jgi:hypothetical protein
VPSPQRTRPPGRPQEASSAVEARRAVTSSAASEYGPTLGSGSSEGIVMNRAPRRRDPGPTPGSPGPASA